MESLPQLIPPSHQLDHILLQVEQAARFFSNPDPTVRRRGEDIFLHVRQSPEAVDFACYALSRAQDAFVLFQAFQAILDNLPSLPLLHCTPSLASLTILREFILAIILARSANDVKKTFAKATREAKSSSSSAQSWSDKSSWPNYLSKRAFQTFAAVAKRICGLEVEYRNQDGGAVEEAIQSNREYILSKLVILMHIPDELPNTEESFLMTRCGISNGIGIISALLEEFSLTHTRLDGGSNTRCKAGSVDHTGLLPLQHRWCKAIIQTHVLSNLFSITLQNLYSTLPGQRHADQIGFFYLMVPIVAKICAWTFLIDSPFAGLEALVSVEEQTRLLKGDEQGDTTSGDDNEAEDGPQRSLHPIFRPLPLSHNHFISKDVILALYQAYKHANDALREERSRGDANARLMDLRASILSIASLRVIDKSGASMDAIRERNVCQLECMRGMIAAEGEDVQRDQNGVYANSLFFMAQLFHCFLSASNDINQLFASIDASILVESLTHLTASTFAFAFNTREDSDEEDDLIELGDDAVAIILACWRILLPYSYDAHPEGAILQQIRSQVYSNVLQPYIELRLRNAGEKTLQGDDNAESDLGQEILTDVDKYEEQLVLLASLARDSNLPACLSLLLTICDGHFVKELLQYYNEDATSFDEKRLEYLWEQVHWLTLITGHIVADHSKGEVASIASQIYSLPNSSQEVILQLIQRLSFTVLEQFSKPIHKLQSPRLTESLLWFTARWIPIYLLTKTTPFFADHLCHQNGVEVIRVLLHHLQGSIRLWNGDADVILQVAALIKSLSLSEGIMQILLGMSEFGETTKIITEGLELLPAKTHGPLISSIVGCIYSSSASQSPERYFEYIKSAIENRFNGVIDQPNFTSSQISQRSDVISQLLNALDMLDGLAASVQPRSAAIVFKFFTRFFDKLSSLVKLYQERNEVVIGIVRVYRTLIGALDLGFGVEQHMITTLNVAVSNLMGGINHRSLLGDSPEMAMEEATPFEGLGLVIELLTDLMLASDSDAADMRTWIGPIKQDLTSDVCLQGFTTIIPLLSSDARSVPRIQRRFANLTSKLWICFPHRIAGLAIGATNEESLQLYQACTSALIICLGFVDSNLVIDCFEAIQKLSMASEKVLNMAHNSVSPNIISVIHHSFNSILSTLLRGILIDALATSLFDLHLLAIRALTHTLASDVLGGWTLLQTEMNTFCSTTQLVPDRVNQNQLRPEEEVKKREKLNQIVAHLFTLCSQSSNLHSNRQARQDERELYLQDARKIAWEGRASIRAD